MNDALPVSAVVTTHNEGHMLAPCLESIRFCRELIVVDLESTDNSAEIAAAHGARVLPHALVPAVELIWCELVGTLEHDWLLTLDPDVELSASLQEDLVTGFPNLSDDIAVVSVPTQYYFNRKPLRGTIWGGILERRLLIHRGRTTLTPEVHADIDVHPGYSSITLPFTGDNLAHHYWMTGYSEWLAKHRRYVREEARARAGRGERATLRGVVTATLNAAYYSFVTRHGYRDGLRGALLSMFWAWYVCRTQWRLRRLAR